MNEFVFEDKQPIHMSDRIASLLNKLVLLTNYNFSYGYYLNIHLYGDICASQTISISDNSSDSGCEGGMYVGRRPISNSSCVADGVFVVVLDPFDCFLRRRR